MKTNVYLTNLACFVGKTIVTFHKSKRKLINFKLGDHVITDDDVYAHIQPIKVRTFQLLYLHIMQLARQRRRKREEEEGDAEPL